MQTLLYFPLKHFWDLSLVSGTLHLFQYLNVCHLKFFMETNNLHLNREIFPKAVFLPDQRAKLYFQII